MNRIKLAVLLGAVALIALIAYFDKSGLGMVENERFAQYSDTKVNVCETKAGDYLFLPSFYDEKSMILSDSLISDDVTVLKASNISSVFINTESGSMEAVMADKDYKENATMKFYDEYGNVLYNEGLKYIKGHGNYTWNSEEWDKKPFGICMKNGDKYTLIANASDPTLIRNDIARNIEEQLEVPYVLGGEFVDLYINNDYYGCYYMCKEFALERGYVLEKEFYDRFKLEYLDSDQGFITERGEPFVIMAPEKCSYNDNDYISQYINEADFAIRNSYENAYELIDMDSFVKRYLSEEITMNYDAGISSAFFYKDVNVGDKRLYYGPGWDFDMSLGNYLDWMEYDGVEPVFLTYGVSCADANEWFKKLYRYEEFRSQTTEYYRSKVRPYLAYLIEDGIDAYKDNLADSTTMDRIRWEDMYEKCGYEVGSEDSYEQLKEFIYKRMQFLDDEWLK